MLSLYIKMASSIERGYTFPCFKDKVVVITGASYGIGEATAIEFAKDGAKLALTGRNAERLNAVAQKCISQGVKAENILQMTGDVTDDEFIEQFINETAKTLGGVDVLVTNAGYLEPRLPGEFNKHKLDREFNVLVRSHYTIIQQCLPHLKNSKGCIVGNSSIFAHTPNNTTMEYCLCKSAVTHMGACLNYELGQDGIRINTVSPGFIGTPPIKQLPAPEKILEVAGNRSGFNRVGKPEEVAAAIQFLASPAASYITGTDLVVDGGQTKVPFLRPEDLQ